MNMKVAELHVKLKKRGLNSQGINKVLQKRLENAINDKSPIVSTVENVGTVFDGKEFDDGAYWKLLDKYGYVIVEEELSTKVETF